MNQKLKKKIVVLIMIIAFILVCASLSFAAYTSMISGSDMSAVQTDVMTVATGTIAIALSIAGVVYIVRALIGG